MDGPPDPALSVAAPSAPTLARAPGTSRLGVLLRVPKAALAPSSLGRDSAPLCSLAAGGTGGAPQRALLMDCAPR